MIAPAFLKCRAAAVPQMFDFSRHNYAIMVPAKIGQVSEWLKSVLREDKSATRQTLETTEDLKDIFTIIRNRHRLAIRPDVLEFLDDLPILSVDYTTTAAGRLRIKDRHEHLASIHREAQVERARVITHPGRIFDEGESLPFSRIGIGSI